MKLYFMKKEALDILKGNLNLIYEKYYTEKDNKWLWSLCNGNPFEEYKEISDFELEDLNSGLSIGEIEFNNCKIIYKNLSFLSESQASDERLWAGLCHSVFYDYLRQRWNYDKTRPKSQKDATAIKSRFFFSGGIRSGLYRNSIAKCWWVGRNTYDKTNKNPFEKLDIIGSNDISTKISDIFYSNNFSANPIILSGIVDALKYFKNEGVQLSTREHIRPALQLLNAIGGGVVLDCLSQEDIKNIVVDNICAIIQGDDLSLESNDEDYFEDSLETEASENNESEIEVENEPIALGQKVQIKNIRTGETKIIMVDFINKSPDMPKLSQCILGRKIGDEFDFLNNTYIIGKIIK